MSQEILVSPALINLAYVGAASLFIIGLKGLTHPRTAVKGNMYGAMGMLLAAIAVLLTKNFSIPLIVAGLLLGGMIGAIAAVKVQMTAMPQMVALFNGFGGIASTLVAGSAFIIAGQSAAGLTRQVTFATAASGLIGTVTFWGSLVAFAKLQELKFLPSGQMIRKWQKLVNTVIGLTTVALAVALIMNPAAPGLYLLLCFSASLLGILLVIPIGGADMPVVVSLLNSYSGLAAAATGFVLSNNVLIIAGSLVGASGIILTRIMCKAMNRSLVNVLFGVMGPSEGAATADDVYGAKVKSASAEEAAMLFDSAQSVVIVPGYGMAVAQAQHVVRDLANLLESRGCTVEFAIHPVAGRMPGHMNVLLAEADVPYDKLKEMDEVNATMDQVDVAIVVGANDVVNPVARTDPSSPIAGMPIIDVDKARTVIVVKRSLSPGFAGIPNPLFAGDNTLMLFGDGKKAVLDVTQAVKAS